MKMALCVLLFLITFPCCSSNGDAGILDNGASVDHALLRIFIRHIAEGRPSAATLQNVIDVLNTFNSPESEAAEHLGMLSLDDSNVLRQWRQLVEVSSEPRVKALKLAVFLRSLHDLIFELLRSPDQLSDTASSSSVAAASSSAPLLYDRRVSIADIDDAGVQVLDCNQPPADVSTKSVRFGDVFQQGAELDRHRVMLDVLRAQVDALRIKNQKQMRSLVSMEERLNVLNSMVARVLELPIGNRISPVIQQPVADRKVARNCGACVLL